MSHSSDDCHRCCRAPSVQQRHRDLKLQAEHARAVLTEGVPRQAAPARSSAERALHTENAVLVEQNHQIRHDLEVARAGLRRQRKELASAATAC